MLLHDDLYPGTVTIRILHLKEKICCGFKSILQTHFITMYYSAYTSMAGGYYNMYFVLKEICLEIKESFGRNIFGQ